MTPENIDQMVKKVSDSEVSITIAENFATSFVLNALAARPGSIVDEQIAMKNAKDNDLGNAWLSRNSAGSGPFSLRTWRPSEAVVIGGAEEGERLNASFPFQPAWIRIAPRRILAWGIDRDSFELTARDVARAPPEPPDLRLGIACPRSGTPRHLR